MDAGNKGFRCFLIGEGSLIIQCCEIIRNKKHKILGIISSDIEVINWCNDNNLTHVGQEDDFYTKLHAEDFDLLFSINNPIVLKKSILSLPRKYTINYHDALLPKYAGVNATSWAIINRENTHGVTWHIVDETIDAGDILKQVTVQLNHNDTAELLNMRCFEAALNSFADLLDELDQGTENPITQKHENRSYYPKYKRPYAGLLINFNQKALDIIAFVNALEFGKINNPLGTPKISIANHFFIVGKIVIAACHAETKYHTKTMPGTITVINENGFQIATADFDVCITRLFYLNGTKVNLTDLIEKYELSLGYRFEYTPAFCTQIDQTYCEIAKHENFWVNRLMNFRSVGLPYQLNFHREHAVKFATFLSEIQFPGSGYDLFERKYTYLVTAFAVYLSRVTMETSFDIGIENVITNPAAVSKSLFSSILPLGVNIDYALSFLEVYEIISKEIQLMAQKLTFCHDITFRYPALQSNALFHSNDFYPIKVKITKHISHSEIEAAGHITFMVTEDGTKYAWAYNQYVIDHKTIEHIDANFKILLSGITHNPQEKISRLPLLTEADRLLLTEWRGKPSNYPKDICIHELIEGHAAKAPADTALVFEGEKLTYGELNKRANMVGNYLKNLGVTCNSLVGIYLDRSFEMIIAILGILKAGGAYVPIDPESPEERVKFIIEDTSMCICLTFDRYKNKLSGFNTQNIALDNQWGIIAKQSSENVVSKVTAANLAYVMYTSGSTGKPKGVIIIHESVLALLDGCEVLVPSAGKVVGTTISTYSFDTSVWEIFSMLCYGRELHIITQELYTSAGAFAEYLLKNKITTTYVNPILIMDTVHQLQKLNTKNYLNYFKTGLEAKKQKVLQAARELSVDMLIANLYGPTETTVCGTFYEFRQAENPESDTPIGKPMPNYEAYIVDRNLELLPPGLPGELLIGGVCVAPGYLNRPSLTNEKFILNPIKKDDKYRLYRTGDMVRFLEDGNIEFIGRMDNQFKIHGYRIEPGEIESTLSNHADVVRAIVSTVQYNASDKRIIAYIVPREKKQNLVKELKEFLTKNLPHYMMPSYFIVMDEIPLQLNGKVNYKALPKPNAIRDIQRQYIAPRNDIEMNLTKIWSEIFKLEEIGVRDNFFDLGGYSLLAVRLFNAIEKIMGVRIPLSHIFEAPTIEQQAIRIMDKGHSETSLVTLRSSGTKPPLFCIHAIDGEVLPYGNLAPHLDEDQPVYGLRLDTQDVQSGTGSIAKLASKYMVDIRRVQVNGPYYLLGYSFGGVLAFEIAQQMYAVGQEVAFLGFFDTINPQYRPLRQPKLPRYQRLLRSINKFRAVSGVQRIAYLMAKLGKWLHKSSEKKRVWDTLTRWKDLYVPEIYPGELTLFRAVDEQGQYLERLDEKLGWEGLPQGGFVICEVPGDHTTIVSQGNIRNLGKRLMACLRAAQARSGGFDG